MAMTTSQLAGLDGRQGPPHLSVDDPVGSVMSIESSSSEAALDAVNPPRLRLRLIVAETAALALAWTIALAWGALSHKYSADQTAISGPALAIFMVVALTAAGVGVSSLFRLYQSRVAAVRSVTVERQALIAVGLSAMALGIQRIVAVGTGDTHPSMAPAVLGGILSFAFLVTARSMFESWVTLLRRNGALSRPVVLVGTSSEAANLSHLLDSHPEIGYRPVGYLSDDNDEHTSLEGVPRLGRVQFTVSAVRDTGATGVLIAANGLPSGELNRLVRSLHDLGIHVHLSSGLTRIGHRRVRQLPMAHEPFFYLEPRGPSRIALGAKRVLDIIGASLVLVLTSPVLLATALIVKLSDGGPIIFHQERIGLHGETIEIRKFRSMSVDAEDQLAELIDLNERNGPLFKLEDDPRVTRVGRFMRASSIDELPQLLDVLAGTLSLVGPRPALADEVAKFDQEMLGRLQMRPGVTGLWQVEARHNPSFSAYRHLDLYYVENWRFGLDVQLLAATFRTVLGDAFRFVYKSRPTTLVHPSLGNLRPTAVATEGASSA